MSVPPPSPLALLWLREDEMRYRARGLFDMAVQVQRLADHAESGEPFPRPCCFVDRGTHQPIDGWLNGGMACVSMPSTGLVLALTPDRAAQLAGALYGWLESFEQQDGETAE